MTAGAPPAARFPLLPRKKNSQKSDFGHVVIVAGSRRMTGAAILAATAALRSGAGLTTLAGPQSRLEVFQRRMPPEVMFLPLPETPAGSLSVRALRPLQDYIRLRRVNALAVGPGLSSEPQTQRLVRGLVANGRVPMVLDADGLNAFAGRARELARAPGPLVLTPHDREFTRLFGEHVPGAREARVRLAKKTAGRYHGVLVLKGSGTVVAEHGRFFVNSTGNPGLAKGGSGDVLTGVLGAFLAQGLRPFEGAAWAVYVHGRAADLAVRRTGQLALTASDVIDFLPKAFGRSVLLE